jgi:hypothetical protein
VSEEVPKTDEVKLMKSFEARDNDGTPVFRVGVWNDGKVSMCMIDRVKGEETTCRESQCQQGQSAQECYEEAKKLFQKFNLQIEERVSET